MKISASLYSNKTSPLEDVVRELDLCRVDYFHIDCPNDPSVFPDIARIRQWSDTPIDLHIISTHPERYIDEINAHRVEYVSYQYEQLKGPEQIPMEIVGKQGLAITSDTPIEVFDDFKDRCSFVLFMSTTPGKSGGRFRAENFRRIRQFHKRYPGVRIHVDGGVNAEVSFILRNMGVASVVSGSFLLNGYSIGASMLQLKSNMVDSHFYVRDFMIGLEDTPVIPLKEASFLRILKTIETYQVALTTIVDEDRVLQGIVTNADVRRGLLKHTDDLNTVTLEDILNRQPVVAYEDQTVTELLKLIKSKPFPISYLPVVNHNFQVVGIVIFHNLIKGEL